MGIRVTLLHLVIRYIIDRIVNWLIVQEQVSIRTPYQEVIPLRIFVVSLPRRGSMPLDIFCFLDKLLWTGASPPTVFWRHTYPSYTWNLSLFLHPKSITGRFAVILPFFVISLFKTFSNWPDQKMRYIFPTHPHYRTFLSIWISYCQVPDLRAFFLVHQSLNDSPSNCTHTSSPTLDCTSIFLSIPILVLNEAMRTSFCLISNFVLEHSWRG